MTNGALELVSPPPGRFDDDPDERAAIQDDGAPAAESQGGTWSGRVVPCEADWFTTPPAQRRWLLRDGRTALGTGVLPLGKVGLLIGEGGVSKTMALVALSIAVATGTRWLGCYKVDTQGRVLALLGEEDTEEVRRRCYHAARATKAPPPEPGAIVVLPLAGVPSAMIEADERGNPVDAPFLAWLRSEIVARGPFALVVVDPLSRFAGADAELENAAATRFVQALESIASETGATVIVAHHTNKTARGVGASVNGASARGSSAIYDGVRWAAALSSEHVDLGEGDAADLAETVTLTVVKSNYSLKGEPVLLRRDAENGGALVALTGGECEVIAAARRAADPGARRRGQRDVQAKERTTVTGSTVLAALAANPYGLTYRGLRAAVAASLGTCSDPALAAALASLGSAVRTERGPRNATVHFLASNAATKAST